MKVFQKLYFIYTCLVFLLSCVVFVPLILFFTLQESWHHAALKIQNAWSVIFFFLIGIRIKISYEVELPHSNQYIFCANHFSYADIPVMCRLPYGGKFIGKASITKVPIFGLMFKRLHIAVDRAKVKSRAQSLEFSRVAIRKGFNLVFFPEGGILSENPPRMISFKDGAFRLAVEFGIPVVPVSLLDNHEILPDGNTDLKPMSCRVKVHAPIDPVEEKLDVDSLRERVFQVIQSELLADQQEFIGAVG